MSLPSADDNAEHADAGAQERRDAVRQLEQEDGAQGVHGRPAAQSATLIGMRPPSTQTPRKLTR